MNAIAQLRQHIEEIPIRDSHGRFVRHQSPRDAVHEGLRAKFGIPADARVHVVDVTTLPKWVNLAVAAGCGAVMVFGDNPIMQAIAELFCLVNAIEAMGR